MFAGYFSLKTMEIVWLGECLGGTMQASPLQTDAGTQRRDLTLFTLVYKHTWSEVLRPDQVTSHMIQLVLHGSAVWREGGFPSKQCSGGEGFPYSMTLTRA